MTPYPEKRGIAVEIAKRGTGGGCAGKITHYLLSFTSPDGRPKANFFTRFGFRASEWEVFAEALCLLCLENEVVDIKETIHGVQYVIIGMIPTPDGRNPTIRTVWQIDSGTDFPD